MSVYSASVCVVVCVWGDEGTTRGFRSTPGASAIRLPIFGIHIQSRVLIRRSTSTRIPFPLCIYTHTQRESIQHPGTPRNHLSSFLCAVFNISPLIFNFRRGPFMLCIDAHAGVVKGASQRKHKGTQPAKGKLSYQDNILI